MGFRNPIQSATDVDTGQPTGPGARLFQDTSGTYPRGVLEFRTGISGDAPAGAELTSYQTTRPDGTIVSAGSRMRVRGADSNGIPAPVLDMLVQEAAAAGYESVARLKADRIVLDSPSIEYGDPGPWLPFTPTWRAPGAPAVGNGSLVGRYRRLGKDRAIDVVIFVSLGSTSSGGTGAWTFDLPAPAVEGRESFLHTKLFTADGNFVGFGLIAPGASQVQLYAPTSASTTRHQPVQNANAQAQPGTGVPQVPGAYTFGAGHNASVFGRYETKS